jgi:hypothetical protein
MSNYSGQHDLTKAFSPNAYHVMLSDTRFMPEFESPITVVICRKKGELGTWEIEVTETLTTVRKKEKDKA